MIKEWLFNLPAAMLYDRFNNFGYGRVYPDETQQLTGTGLVQAIDGCISAAGHELDVGRAIFLGKYRGHLKRSQSMLERFFDHLVFATVVKC